MGINNLGLSEGSKCTGESLSQITTMVSFAYSELFSESDIRGIIVATLNKTPGSIIRKDVRSLLPNLNLTNTAFDKLFKDIRSSIKVVASGNYVQEFVSSDEDWLDHIYNNEIQTFDQFLKGINSFDGKGISYRPLMEEKIKIYQNLLVINSDGQITKRKLNEIRLLFNNLEEFNWGILTEKYPLILEDINLKKFDLICRNLFNWIDLLVEDRTIGLNPQITRVGPDVIRSVLKSKLQIIIKSKVKQLFVRHDNHLLTDIPDSVVKDMRKNDALTDGEYVWNEDMNLPT